MDLQTIAGRTGVPLQRLRYVLDHRVLPGTEHASRGHRRPRSFTLIEAIGIACAGAMLEAGLRRAVAKRCILALLQPLRSRASGPSHFERLIGSRREIVFELVDGVRWRLADRGGSTTGWVQLDGSEPAVPTHPIASFGLNLTSLRDKLAKNA